MWWTRRCVSDRFSSGLVVWMVALSAIIPSLDRELMATDVTIASGQHENCAHPHHNHTLCIQFGKQRWSKGSSIPLVVLPPTLDGPAPRFRRTPSEVAITVATQSRAPPLPERPPSH